MREPYECGVSGCENVALALVLPTYGQTEHCALRCEDCLEYDLDRDWFDDWRESVRIDREIESFAGGESV